MNKIKVGKSKFGRGVFATTKISKGETVEICPVILVPNGKIHLYIDRLVSMRDSKCSVNLQLSRYTFKWTASLKALALGYGSLYNHSIESNMKCVPVYKNKTIKFIATSEIKKGQELFIDYNYNPTRNKLLNKVETQVAEIDKNESDWAEKRYKQNVRDHNSK